MIKKLRSKFIKIAMLSVAAVLAVIICVINVVNYNAVISQADRTLEMLAGNDGRFPVEDRLDSPEGVSKPDKKPDDRGFGQDIFGRGGRDGEMSPEAPFETRFFSADLDSEGNVTSVYTDNIAAVDEETAADYALKAVSSGRAKGTMGSYRYTVTDGEDGTQAVFLDITQSMSSFETFLAVSILIAAVGLGAVFVLIWFFSKKMIKPVAESYEKQKQFITDAGHDIKTPITIIDADAEVLEMESGKSEWIDDIRLQTARLAELTRDLIFLSRMEEDNPSILKMDFPFSDVVADAAQSFQSLAVTQNKQFDTDIEPMMTMCGDEKSIRQMVTILTDNAVKYSPEGGRISVKANRKGRKIVLIFENTTADTLGKEETDHMFDRFYRAEKSRGTDGGYGIGLSIAKAVAEAHGGDIAVKVPADRLIDITVTLPEGGGK